MTGVWHGLVNRPARPSKYVPTTIRLVYLRLTGLQAGSLQASIMAILAKVNKYVQFGSNSDWHALVARRVQARYGTRLNMYNTAVHGGTPVVTRAGLGAVGDIQAAQAVHGHTRSYMAILGHTWPKLTESGQS